MKVRAIAFGFYRQKRKIGEVFEFEGIPSGKWMEPVDEAAREAFKKARIKVAPAPAPKAEDPKGAPGKGEKEKEAGGKSTGDQNVI